MEDDIVDDVGDDFADDIEEPVEVETEVVEPQEEEEEAPPQEEQPDEDENEQEEIDVLKTTVEPTAVEPIVTEEDENVLTTLKSISNIGKYKFLTKYELSRVIGLRSSQISRGAPLYISLTDTQKDLLRKVIYPEKIIAEWELAQNKIPFLIRRKMPTTAHNFSSNIVRLNSLLR